MDTFISIQNSLYKGFIMYYAMYDSVVSKQNPGFGFANSKNAIAFKTKKERQDFIEKRKSFDFSVKPITRKEVNSFLEELPFPHEYGVQVGSLDSWEYVVLKINKNYSEHKIGDIV